MGAEELLGGICSPYQHQGTKEELSRLEPLEHVSLTVHTISCDGDL